MGLASLESLHSAGGRPPLSQIHSVRPAGTAPAAPAATAGTASARGGVVDMTGDDEDCNGLAGAGGGLGREAGSTRAGDAGSPQRGGTLPPERASEGEEAFDFATMRGALLSSPGATSESGYHEAVAAAAEDVSGDDVAASLVALRTGEERPRGGVATRGGRGSGGTYTVQPRGRVRNQNQQEEGGDEMDGNRRGSRGGRGGRRASRGGAGGRRDGGRGRGAVRGGSSANRVSPGGGSVGGEPAQLPPQAAAAAAAEARAASRARIGMPSPTRTTSSGSRGQRDGAQPRRQSSGAAGRSASGGTGAVAVGGTGASTAASVDDTLGGPVHAWDPQAAWPPTAPAADAATAGTTSQPRHSVGVPSPTGQSPVQGPDAFLHLREERGAIGSKVSSLQQTQTEDDEWEYVLYVLDPQVRSGAIAPALSDLQAYVT